MDWATTILTSFMASSVECIEALTVVLAVGATRGWRSAFAGTGAALCVLLILVLGFGQSLSQIPIQAVRIVIGTMLLLFGLRWLRKAILRAAGIIKLRDETTVYARQVEDLHRQTVHPKEEWDVTAIAAAFKIVMLEGIEVVFIVLALGTSGTASDQLIIPASVGALAALTLVSMLGFLLRRPLANIPENALKFCVGVLIASFGTFWVGEGIHLAWPGDDWAIAALTLAYLTLAYLLVLACRIRFRFAHPVNIAAPANSDAATPQINGLKRIVNTVIALFVDDGQLALGILIWIGIMSLCIAHTSTLMQADYVIFPLGCALLLAYSAINASGRKT